MIVQDTATSYLIITFIAFAAGAFSGFFARGLVDKGKIRIEANTFVLVSVTLIWTLSMVVDIVSPTYETSPLLHGLMGAIVGFFFQPWKKHDDKKNDK